MLTWDGNRHLITKIKAAITASIRPCAMIFHEQPTDPWLPFDFKLLEAFQMLQDETCPKCGHPVWLCRSTSNNVAFKVQTATCYAEKAQLAAEDSKKSKKEKADSKDRAKWGQYTYVVPYNPPNADGPLPTRREFYEEQAAR